jgi:hypothetical protein
MGGELPISDQCKYALLAPWWSRFCDLHVRNQAENAPFCWYGNCFIPYQPIILKRFFERGAPMKKAFSILTLLFAVSAGMADTIFIEQPEALPSRPIGQTIAGVVLCAVSVPMLVIGMVSFSAGGNSQDPQYQRNNYGLGKFLGVAGCAEVASGTILLVRAKTKWRIYNRAANARNGKVSMSTGVQFIGEF